MTGLILRFSKGDAALIAAFTALVTESQPERSAPDPRLRRQLEADARRAAKRAEQEFDRLDLLLSTLVSA